MRKRTVTVMRLIDADELKTAFPCGETVRTESVRATIDHMPTVDAVVPGHWIKFGVSDKDGNQQYRCSVCECEDIHSPLVKVNYCWNCGARMDGKGGEQHD